MAPQFRWLEKGESALGMHYIRKLWGENHILARNEALFNWQYSPVQEGVPTGFLIAEDAGKPVGCIGRMPIDVHIHGKPLAGTVIALYVVSPDYRGQALGLELLKRAYANLDIIITMGINSRVARLYKMLGQHIIPECPRLVARGSLDAVHSTWQLACGDEKFPEDIYAQSPSFNRAFSATGQIVKLDLENLQEWDQFWSEKIAPITRGTKRDAKYIKWRYLDHPVFNYDLVMAKRAGKICGFAGMREAPLSSELKALRIVDFIAEDEEAADILNGAISERVDEKTAFVEHISLGSMARYLAPLGLRRENSKLFSVYFNPPDLKVTSVMSAFASQTPNLPIREFIDANDCYITISDGDQDRPN